MSGVLLDTNVISELRKACPDPSVVAQPEAMLFVSMVTFAEVRVGIDARGNPNGGL